MKSRCWDVHTKATGCKLWCSGITTTCFFHCTFTATYILLRLEISYLSFRSHHCGCLLHRTSQQVHLMSSTCRALYPMFVFIKTATGAHLVTKSLMLQWPSGSWCDNERAQWAYGWQTWHSVRLFCNNVSLYWEQLNLGCLNHIQMSAPFISLERDLFYRFCTLWCGCYDSVSSEQLASLVCYSLFIISGRSGLYRA